MPTTPYAASIGTVSHGTLDENDVFAALIVELALLDPDAAAEILADWQTADDDERAFLLNEDLFDALDAHAPPCCYFGARPGDGSDFGFWPYEDVLSGHHEDVITLPAGYDLTPLPRLCYCPSMDRK